MATPDKEFERADDPRERCQANGGQGQCPFKKTNGTDYCPRHQGNNKGNNLERKKYQLAKYQEILDFQSEHPGIKDLNEEIGVLRMTLLKRLQDCDGDDQKLLMYSGSITNLTEKITIAVEKWHKVQMQTNAIMDKQQALQFIQALGDIIDKELNDVPDKEEILKRIGDRMITELQNRTGNTLRSQT